MNLDYCNLLNVPTLSLFPLPFTLISGKEFVMFAPSYSHMGELTSFMGYCICDKE